MNTLTSVLFTMTLISYGIFMYYFGVYNTVKKFKKEIDQIRKDVGL